MNALKRIFLYCRMLVAEMPWPNYLWSTVGLVGFTVFLTLVSGDSENIDSLLKREYTIWEAGSVLGLLASVGWIGGIALSAAFNNIQFKEEDRTVRTLSLPLSSGERFAASLAIHFVYVPLMAIGIPVLLTVLVGPLLPDVFLLPPAPRYFVRAMLVGWMAHTLTTTLWLFPAYAYGKRAGWVITVTIGLFIAYLAFITEPNQVYFAQDVAPVSDVYGIDEYVKFHKPSETYRVRVELEEQNTIFGQVFERLSLNALLTLLIGVAMISAAGLALTRKTA